MYKTPLRPDVADSLKVSRDRPKSPTISEHDVQGLAAFDASSYENQHRHGNHKHILRSLDAPVVEVRTEKVSEYNAAPIVSGVSLSPQQLINYHNGDFR